MGDVVDFEIGRPHGFNGDGYTHSPPFTGISGTVIETPEPVPSPAVQILGHAASLIDGDRNTQHGDRKACHLKIAIAWDFWNKVKRNPLSADTEFDVAVKMALLKLIRTQQGAYNADDIVDAIGYLSLAGEFEAAT